MWALKIAGRKAEPFKFAEKILRRQQKIFASDFTFFHQLARNHVRAERIGMRGG